MRVMFLISILAIVFSGCKSNLDQAAHNTPDSVYVTSGDMIVKSTFDSLRNSLLRAIAKEGFEGAITFCNENALTLTNTYADSITIRRTALRWRNPKNQPDSLEQAVLHFMSSELGTKTLAPSKLIRDGGTGEIHYFKPIMMQGMCLSCHGKPNDQIHDETMTRLKKLYPSDQAVDFMEGDLRGAWHIKFSPVKK
jgi:hypothetical protein